MRRSRHSIDVPAREKADDARREQLPSSERLFGEAEMAFVAMLNLFLDHVFWASRLVGILFRGHSLAEFLRPLHLGFATDFSAGDLKLIGEPREGAFSARENVAPRFRALMPAPHARTRERLLNILCDVR